MNNIFHSQNHPGLIFKRFTDSLHPVWGSEYCLRGFHPFSKSLMLLRCEFYISGFSTRYLFLSLIVGDFFNNAHTGAITQRIGFVK